MSNVRVMTRKQLFTIMQRQNLNTIDEKLEFLENHLLQPEDFSTEQVNVIKHDLSRFKSEVKSRWAKALRKEEYFLEKNKEWLHIS